ncbi:MAG TPA: N-acyl homoserine lactonase family protein [Steroidobacteraceae bacterium]|jgi:glyoxylase-like metal-dependent hydrolase (beta-lactamase superfamily II)
MPQPYEIYAVRYARHSARRASENFIGGDEHDGPMPLDYFVWALKGPERTFVIDSGFDAAAAQARGREFMRCPGEGLRMIGIDPAQVRDVIVTHMHYDHIGNPSLFPQASYHLQDAEMQYCTGRCMCHSVVSGVYDIETVTAMVRKVYQRRVQFYDGAAELTSGVSIHRLGGHTRGLQVVRVFTRRGWMVLASDASHLYANMQQSRPFPVVDSVADMLEGYQTMRRLADAPDNIIPGHDPLVMTQYESPRPELSGAVVRLDADPIRR